MPLFGLRPPKTIDPSPALDDGGLACFRKHIKGSSCYLEYGCGGSTVYAVSVARVKTVVAVDSDPAWISAVRTSIGESSSTVAIENCDIGRVRNWGRPASSANFRNFWRYMATPWARAAELGCSPDTILIDGRFRVASFLFSLVSAREGTAVLFDDYLDRPMYSVVEEFCPLQESHGRMGLFSVKKGFPMPEICARIAEYSVQPE